MHPVLSVEASKKPKEHAVQAAADEPEYLPTTQLAHDVEADAPAVDKKVPASQPSHAVAPSAATNVPATHDVQALTPVAAENLPAGQDEHWSESDAPVVIEKVPTAQAVQVVRPAEVA